MNPIVNMMSQAILPAQLNNATEMFGPIFSAMQNGGNPMAALGQMANNDPRMQDVINVIRQNGGLQQAVYSEAQKRNINPNDALNQARQMIQSFNMR